tara:strand:+ start:13416 stop:14393 length:978 start_codon:yes stop_codon:yes gene_type:complete
MISVIIPVYNKAKYLRKCINSVLNQTLPANEIIIIDDGSTDDSYEVLNSFSSNEKIRILRQENAGPGNARNRGLEMASSEWVSFIDADDYWQDNFIEVALSKINLITNCNVFMCGANWYDSDYVDVRLPILTNEKNAYEGEWYVPRNLSPLELLSCMNFFATGAVIAKKTMLIRYGGYFDRIFCNSGEDGFLWIQVMFNETIYRYLKPLVNINTNASDLGIKRLTKKPTPPALIYDDLLYKNIEKSRHSELTSLLSLMAFSSFRLRIYDVELIKALKLLKKFPNLIKYKPYDYPNIYWAFVYIPINRYFIKPFLSIKRRIFNYGK